MILALSKSANLLRSIGLLKSSAKMSSQALNFKNIAVSVPKEFVYHVKLNRPEKLNAFNHECWIEIKQCFEQISEDENCRAIVLSAEGRIFTAGIDFNDFIHKASELANVEDVARKGKFFHNLIQLYQESMSSVEACRQPVIAAVHSACIGAGVDLITAADIRYCSKDAWFQVKEVAIGLAADVGSLQRLPKVVGSDSLARELCYTARKMFADEALSCGLISKVFGTQEELLNGAINLAENIAKKSPVAVQATKRNLIYSRDHTIQDGLNHIKWLNQLNLQSEDLIKAATAALTKDENVKFSKL